MIDVEKSMLLWVLVMVGNSFSKVPTFTSEQVGSKCARTFDFELKKSSHVVLKVASF